MDVTTTATAKFSIDAWDEAEPRQHGTAAVARTELEKVFTGDVEGSSRVEMLSVTAAGGDSRAYVALETFDATVDGRAGTFVLVHHGIQGGPNEGASWTIAPGTGSGELAGITGTAQLVRCEDGSHELVLEYTLGPEA